jgi:hypothetical protein
MKDTEQMEIRDICNKVHVDFYPVLTEGTRQ